MGLAAGLYQRWRTVAHCTQPEPRHLLQLESEDTQKQIDFDLFLGALCKQQRLETLEGHSSLEKQLN